MLCACFTVINMYCGDMFSAFKDLPAACQALATAIIGLCASLDLHRDVLSEPPPVPDLPEPDLAPLKERMDEFDRGRALWEANMEAELLKADSKYKSARNAEERAKTHARGADEESIEIGHASPEELREAYRGWLPGADVEAGANGGVLALRSGVESVSAKAQAVRAKFGV